jgi:nuclear transport factor 2 (NTF2) superfamily protein
LRKHLWSHSGNRIAVRFEYEYHDKAGQWFRCHGNELWEFDDFGYMRWRDMSGNDIPIDESDRRLSR